jgi:hypothetical protein
LAECHYIIPKTKRKRREVTPLPAYTLKANGRMAELKCSAGCMQRAIFDGVTANPTNTDAKAVCQHASAISILEGGIELGGWDRTQEP